MLAPAALLPDALVGLVPVLADPVDDAGEVDPRVVVDRRAVAVVEVDGVDQLAVDVELELVARRRCRSAPAPSRGSPRGGRGPPPSSSARPSIPYMIWSGPCPPGAALAEALAQPLHERRRLLGEAEPQQRVERERGVADPRVAVVPVATAAELLGEARRGRRDDPAGGPEGEQLQRERRAVHHLAPAALVARLRRASGASTRWCGRTPRASRPPSRGAARSPPAPARARTSRSRPARSVISQVTPVSVSVSGVAVSSAREMPGRAEHHAVLVEDDVVCGSRP